jgi:hypothetical protein
MLWPAAVAVVFTLAQLVLVVPGSGLGWDETVYTSQVSGRVPAAFFSAPRARGVSFLVAPVAAWTADVLPLRLYLAVLSGTALLGALWAWRTLLPARVTALGGGLFASLWITLFYGPEVMPNLWSALGALAAVGCFLNAVHRPRTRGPMVGLWLACAVVALMRPPDAAWLALALTGAALTVRGWRRPGVLAAVLTGTAAGAAHWVIEAYVSYGGLLDRLRRAGEIQGGMGRHLAVVDQLQSLSAGRTLCRPCGVPWQDHAAGVWWLVLPVLATVGTAAAVRGRRPATAVLPLAAGLLTALPYLFLIDYAAPRFLLPAYALLMLPVADGLWHAAARPAGRLRPAVCGLLAVLLVTHVGVQLSVLDGATDRAARRARELTAVAERLHHLGVRGDCVVSGDHAPQLGYYAGCDSRQIGGHDGSVTPAGLRRLARRHPVAYLVRPRHRPPAAVRGWRRARLPDWTRYSDDLLYVSLPGERPGGASRAERTDWSSRTPSAARFSRSSRMARRRASRWVRRICASWKRRSSRSVSGTTGGTGRGCPEASTAANTR